MQQILPVPIVTLESHVLVVAKLSQKNQSNILTSKFGIDDFSIFEKYLNVALLSHCKTIPCVEWDSILLSYNGANQYTGFSFFPGNRNIFVVDNEILNPLAFGLIITLTAITRTLEESLNTDFKRFLEANLIIVRDYISSRSDGKFIFEYAA